MLIKDRIEAFGNRILEFKSYGKTTGICPECGGMMYKEINGTYLTYPPANRYICYDCDYIEYKTIQEGYPLDPSWEEDLKELVKKMYKGE